jgi:hypothetical protein
MYGETGITEDIADAFLLAEETSLQR